MNDDIGNEDPTLVVEVPALPPRAPKNGYAFVALAPQGTDINSIDAEMWEISLIEVFQDETFSYLGRRAIDGTTCNVWWAVEGDAFVAQKLAA